MQDVNDNILYFHNILLLDQNAYKKMMLTNHPDRGGSPYISAKLSEAKDLLDK